MVRALIFVTLICVCSMFSVTEARGALSRRRTTTATPALTAAAGSEDEATLTVAAAADEDKRTYHPAEVQKPRVIEQYDHRSLDGHYEFRYVLSNGNTRYERAYWMPGGKTMVLARKGYYSYMLPNRQYLTVFYTADHNGYHQDSLTYTNAQPVLPRSLDVPEYDPPATTTTTQRTPHRPGRTTERTRRPTAVSPVRKTNARATTTTTPKMSATHQQGNLHGNVLRLQITQDNVLKATTTTRMPVDYKAQSATTEVPSPTMEKQSSEEHVQGGEDIYTNVTSNEIVTDNEY